MLYRVKLNLEYEKGKLLLTKELVDEQNNTISTQLERLDYKF